MTEALNSVESGEITTATRSVEIDGVAVKEGQTIVLHNGQLVLAADSVEDACLGLLEHAHADQFELITMFYGIDIPKTEVNRIADVVRRAYPEQEVEIQEGGQPHYQFIIAIE
jgi:dihydroxyacetone kinase-like predicted kinase